MGKRLITLPKPLEARWEGYSNILPVFRSSFKAELALLQPSKDGDTADLTSIRLIEAGLNHTELIKVAANFDVQKSANTLRGTVRQAKNALNLIAATCREGVHPRESGGHAIPFSLTQELLCLLDISDVYRTPSDNARRQPVRPCPSMAQELYDRLLLARRHARWLPALRKRALLLGVSPSGTNGNTTRQRPWYITDSELSVLLEPVVVEMRACLEYVESFCRFLETTTGGSRGRDYDWVDLSELRTCVFKLMGFWPHDVEHNYPGYAFDLPSDLGLLLYPQLQISLDRGEMVQNLEEVVLGPGWDRLMRLEVIARGR